MTQHINFKTDARCQPVFGCIALFAIALMAAATARASVFEQLGSVQRAAIVEICLPVRYEAGIEAWRECIEREAIAVSQPGAARAERTLGLDERFALQKLCSNVADEACYTRALAALAQVPEPQLGDLRDDEQHALARACFRVQNTRGPAEWRRCMTQQAATLRNEPDVDLDALGLTERNAALNSCNNSPVPNYRRCLNAAGAPFAKLATEPLAAADREQADREQATSASGLLAALPDTVAARPVNDEPQPTRRAGSVAIVIPQSAADTPDPQPTAQPEPSGLATSEPVTRVLNDGANERGRGDALAQAAPLPVSESASTDTPGRAADEPDQPVSAFERLNEAVNGLDATGRTALLAAAALPLLALLGIVAARRKTAEPYYERDAFDDQVRQSKNKRRDERRFTHDAALPLSKSPDTDAIRSRFSNEADDLFDSLDSATSDEYALQESVESTARSVHRDRDADLTSDKPENYPEVDLDDAGFPQTHKYVDLNTPPTQPAPAPPVTPSPDETPTRLVNSREALYQEADHELGPASPQDTHAAAHAASGVEQRASFAAWLQTEPEPLQRQHAIELLIYWVAYADDRYEASSRQAILENTQPDAHTRIKACALKKDGRALGEALRFLVLKASKEQRLQVIELLVALLVTDATPTPVQNTLLRFFADVFGLGIDQLNKLWIDAFDSDLPKLPRVDRLDWWEARDHRSLLQRDARAVANLQPRQQYLARLGLPLNDESSDVAIENAWRLAAERCNPARFDALSERERQMAERQMTRFDEAREGLLSDPSDDHV